MPGLQALTGRSVTDLWKQVKDPETFWDELHDQITDAVRDLLESALEEELLERSLPGSRHPLHQKRLHPPQYL